LKKKTIIINPKISTLEFLGQVSKFYATKNDIDQKYYQFIRIILNVNGNNVAHGFLPNNREINNDWVYLVCAANFDLLRDSFAFRDIVEISENLKIKLTDHLNDSFSDSREEFFVHKGQILLKTENLITFQYESLDELIKNSLVINYQEPGFTRSFLNNISMVIHEFSEKNATNFNNLIFFKVGQQTKNWETKLFSNDPAIPGIEFDNKSLPQTIESSDIFFFNGLDEENINTFLKNNINGLCEIILLMEDSQVTLKKTNWLKSVINKKKQKEFLRGISSKKS
jgi:hypothetical protein